MKLLSKLALIMIAIVMHAPPVFSQDTKKTEVDRQYAEQEVAGWQLMNEDERNAYRSKMRSLKTLEEQEAYRRAHHEKMRVRAAENGVVLKEPKKLRTKKPGRDKPRRNMRRNQPVFDDYDRDSDGYITAEELGKGRAKRMEQRAKEGRAMKNASRAPAFSNIDTDADGRVSKDEFAAHKAQQQSKK